MTPTWLQDSLPLPLFASSVSCLVCRDVTTNKPKWTKGALNFPFSPHSVGLITTSYSVLQPLRKQQTLLRQNALATNMAFFFFPSSLNCNSVTDSSASSCVRDLLLLTVGAKQTTKTKRTSTAAFTELFGAGGAAFLPRCWALVYGGGRSSFFFFFFVGPGLHQLGLDLRSVNNLRHFRRKFTSEKRLLRSSHISIFLLFFLKSQSFYFFSC